MEYKQLKLSLKTAYQSILGYIPNTYPFHPCKITFFQDGQDPCIHFPGSNLPQCFEMIFVNLSPGTAWHSQENHGDSPRGRDGKDHKT
jgi:hypothetical protein